MSIEEGGFNDEENLEDTVMSKESPVNTCFECGCREGQIHERGCEMEPCPFCDSDQLIACFCLYEQLGIEDLPEDDDGWDEMFARWDAVLDAKGRIPYIYYPLMCAYCGGLWPRFFMVEKKEWEKYIEPKMQGEILCWDCYAGIRQLIDGSPTTFTGFWVDLGLPDHIEF